MPVLQTSGTQTATVGTEHTLATVATSGTYQLVVDLSTMVDGDVVELRIKTKLLSGSTERQAWVATYIHNQTNDNVYSVPVPSPYSFAATLKQTAPTTTSTGSQTLPVTPFNVASTAGFPTTGSFVVGGNTVTYTGITATSFTGASGGSGTISAATTVVKPTESFDWAIYSLP